MHARSARLGGSIAFFAKDTRPSSVTAIRRNQYPKVSFLSLSGVRSLHPVVRRQGLRRGCSERRMYCGRQSSFPAFIRPCRRWWWGRCDHLDDWRLGAYAGHKEELCVLTCGAVRRTSSPVLSTSKAGGRWGAKSTPCEADFASAIYTFLRRRKFTICFSSSLGIL
jgi:hypothetical protein